MISWIDAIFENIKAEEKSKRFVLYKENKVEMVGSIKEIAEKEGITIRSAKYYNTPSYKKYRRKYNGESKVIYKLGEMSVEEKINKIIELYNMGFSYKEAMDLMKGEL